MEQTVEQLTAQVRAEQMMRVAEILKTIAHPVRLAVLELLGQHESMSVTELQDGTGIEQSLLSHHLIKMKDKGVLKSHRDGKNHYYQLADRHLLQIFNCMEKCSLIL